MPPPYEHGSGISAKDAHDWIRAAVDYRVNTTHVPEDQLAVGVLFDVQILQDFLDEIKSMNSTPPHPNIQYVRVYGTRHNSAQFPNVYDDVVFIPVKANLTDYYAVYKLVPNIVGGGTPCPNVCGKSPMISCPDVTFPDANGKK